MAKRFTRATWQGRGRDVRGAALGVLRLLFAATAVLLLMPMAATGLEPLPPEGKQPSQLRRLPPVRPQPSAASELTSPPTATGVSLTSFTASRPSETADRIETLEARVRELEVRAANDAASADDASAVASPGEPIEVGADTSLFARWKHGLDLESKNKDFRVHIGGRTQYDNSFFANDPDLTVSPAIGGIGPQRDSFQFRRGRLRIEGTMYENFDFAAEYDFVNTLAPASPSSGQPVVAVPGITDLWGTITHLPRIGNVRIGNMKEPIGMEHVNSSRFLPFIERSFLMDVVFGPFNNGFTPGVMMFDRREDERATWALGWFSAHNNAFGYGIGPESAMTGRVTWLPVYDVPSGGRYLWHLGLAGSLRGADEGVTRARARGNIRSGPPGVLNPIYVDTGTMAASMLGYFAAETAIAAGPLTVQAEFTGVVITGAQQPFSPDPPVDRGTPLFYGGYIEALWFLTGESNYYNTQRATFDRVTPFENFFLVSSDRGRANGLGAWQIGARYDSIKLNSNGINGGILHGFTFGVNWYWNPNMKVQFNYDLTHRSAVDDVPPGFINAWGLRYAMDF